MPNGKATQQEVSLWYEKPCYSHLIECNSRIFLVSKSEKDFLVIILYEQIPYFLKSAFQPLYSTNVFLKGAEANLYTFKE